MFPIKVALVGSNVLLRQGLRQLLDPDRFVVAGEARDFDGLETLLNAGLAPDLVIADLSTQTDHDLEQIRKIRAVCEGCRIVVLANRLQMNHLVNALRAGVDGYLVNELSAEAFSLSLLLVMQGEKVLPGPLANLMASDQMSARGAGVPGESTGSRLSESHRNLTERERQILQCLLNGYSNKLIARALDITEGTVKVHLKGLMKKIDANNRTQAALWARNNGIMETMGMVDA